MMGAMNGFEKAAAPARISTNSLVEQLLNEARIHDAAALLNRSGVTLRLMTKLAECMLAAELKHHLLGQVVQDSAKLGNYRNGSSPKTVLSPSGMLELAVPRVRFSTFVPRLIPRYQRQLPGFDDNILALYGRGLSMQEQQFRLLGLYGASAWGELGSVLTDEVSLHTRNWQTRKLERSCAMIYFDALQIQNPSQGQAAQLPLFFALGMRADGRRDVFGFWIGDAADGTFWHNVMCELKDRGLIEPGVIACGSLPVLREAAALLYPAAHFRLVR